MSPKDAALQISQERNCAIVDADNDAMADYNQYAINNGLASLRHLNDKDDGPLMFADPLGDVSGGALGESAELLAKGKEWKLLTALFLIVQRTARKKMRQCAGCANSK
jgi:hypothetical protein